MWLAVHSDNQPAEHNTDNQLVNPSCIGRVSYRGGGGGGGGGAQGFPLPSESSPQKFESLCTILYGSMVLGDFSWSFD